MRRFALAIVLWVAATSSFAETSAYLLVPGDTLDISVWKEEGLQRQVIVLPDGKISFPLAGHIEAAGRTPSQLERALFHRLKKYLAEPVVTVTVQSVAGASVFVMGQVKNSGKFPIQGPTTVMQALSLSGGLAEFAATRRIKVLRRVGGEQIALEFNYHDVQSGRDLSSNIYLKNGDVVVVPEKGLFE